MDQWLVRTASNVIGGPYTREQVVSKIQSGELGPQDEVCQANQFWISLHEHQEVEQQLGIRIPRPARVTKPGSDEDVTETQLENPENPKAAEGGEAPEAGVPDEPPIKNVDEDGLPEMPDVPEDGDGSTSVMSRRPVRESAARANVIPSSASPTATPTQLRTVAIGTGGASMAAPKLPPKLMLLSPQLERSSVWRGLAWVLVVAACVLVYAVLRILQSGGPA